MISKKRILMDTRHLLPQPLLIGSTNWILNVPHYKGVYLLHIHPSYKQAGHYKGCTAFPMYWRLEKHYTGKGAALLRHVLDVGHLVYLVAYWPDAGFDLECMMKDYRRSPDFCPVCQGEQVIKYTHPDDVQFMAPHVANTWQLQRRITV
jgi:hypothetical protein